MKPKPIETFLIAVLLIPSTVACGKSGSDSSSRSVTSNSSMTASQTASQVAQLPTGTKFEVTLPAEISTGKNRSQDRLVLPVHSPLIGANPALKGAKIEGHLENVIKAERGKKASLHLVFDDIVLRDGTAKPINAALTETKLESKTQGKFLRNAGVVLGGAVAGHFIGSKVGKKHGGLAGAAVATAFVLSSPGGEVVLKKGTELDFKLKSPLEVTSAGV
jgi:hypothetical protein